MCVQDGDFQESERASREYRRASGGTQKYASLSDCGFPLGSGGPVEKGGYERQAEYDPAHWAHRLGQVHHAVCDLEGTKLSREELMIVEDPVEYRIGGINGMNPKAGLTFACGLRSTLRADPYVVMVGDTRDHQAARISVEAAQTGAKRVRRWPADRRPSGGRAKWQRTPTRFVIGRARSSRTRWRAPTRWQ
jgi:Type II/IV secretion system protein